ncbi:GAF domain-containing protein [Vibrio crassostreae]|uniref:GAF domain-containing protein n=1 Tax=Vibrio crassostreae TaxID=246167 RepID=UPI001B317091|nr:GAF domain-containing protein [Vibrio crassostreae]
MNTDKVRSLVVKLDKFYQVAQQVVALWNTLILPLLIGVFVTHLFNTLTAHKTIDNLVWVMVAIVTLIHILVMILQFKGSTIDTMLVEYQDKSRKLSEIKQEFETLKHSYTQDMGYFSSQSNALRITSEALSFAVGRLRNIELAGEELKSDDIDKMVHSLLWPLVVLREKLFSFDSGVLWNIALYTPQPNGDLAPVWRMHDKRIEVKNRVWSPGFGVVGLSYLHGTLKYYEDVSQNTEAIQTSSRDKETYKSIIAIPVIPCEDSSSNLNHNPVGVLVLTSSEECQFNLDRDARFLRTHANLMAIFIEKLRSYVEHNTSDKPKGGQDE